MTSQATTAAPASTKRKISIDTDANSSKARKIVVINPPQLPRRRRSILRGGTRETTTPPTCEHIACRLSCTRTCRESETTPFAIFEDRFASQNPGTTSWSIHPPHLQYQPQPRTSISWDPAVTDSNRTQEQLEDYHALVYPTDKYWWEDPHLVKACESFLTRPGKLLDAFMVLSPKDVKSIMWGLPMPIRKMTREISRQLANSREMLEWEKEDSEEDSEEEAEGEEGHTNGHDSLEDVELAENAALIEKFMEGYDGSENAEDATEDKQFTGDNSENEIMNDGTEDSDNQVDIPYIAPEERVAHRRALLEYMDSRLDQFIFCRYEGTVRVPPSVCPISILRGEDYTLVDKVTKVYGPISYIVSNFDCKTRPLLSPIRFSQAAMAMKEHRLGESPKRWVETLDDFKVHFGMTANHLMLSDYWIANDRLLVRTQSWIHAHNDYPQTRNVVRNFLNGKIILAYDSGNIMSWMCRHLILNPDKHLFDYVHPEESTKLHRCEKCAMEYRIDIVKEIPLDYTSVTHRFLTNFCAVVTVWRDFGRCLTPYDPRWAAHFSEYESGSFTSQFPAQNQAARCVSEEECATDWELGGIMRAYEGSDDFHVATELSLRGLMLKWLMSTEELRLREADRIRAKEFEKQRLEEEVEEKLEVREEKIKSLGQRLREQFLGRKRRES